MNIQAILEEKLSTLKPTFLEIINESGNHNVPTGSQSHFKVVVVSPDFANLLPLQRHRCVYELCADELDGPIHALSLHLYSIDEWAAQGQSAVKSPPCRGGSKFERED